MSTGVAFEWNYINQVIPQDCGITSDVLCLCTDGKVRKGDPTCGDGYWFLDRYPKDNKRVLFWTPIPDADDLFNKIYPDARD